jgi:hypothetical protein
MRYRQQCCAAAAEAAAALHVAALRHWAFIGLTTSGRKHTPLRVALGVR